LIESIIQNQFHPSSIQSRAMIQAKTSQILLDELNENIC
jgi:hypothetical protein